MIAHDVCLLNFCEATLIGRATARGSLQSPSNIAPHPGEKALSNYVDCNCGERAVHTNLHGLQTPSQAIAAPRPSLGQGIRWMREEAGQ
jgi:hypothetical protein